MKNLYFVAVFPPPDIIKEIKEIKIDFCTRFNSCKSLRNDAHITLIDPFSVDQEAEQQYIQLFQQITPVRKFLIELKDFGGFPNKRNPVIFIKPLPSEALIELRKNCRKKMIWQKQGFNPHVTVAYRDLTFENFERAWEEYQFKKYSAEFEVSEVLLMKHDGMKWQKLSSLALV